MKRFLLCLGACCCLAARFAWSNDELRVMAQVIPESGAVVSQKLVLQVDVSTDTWFTAAPQYPELELPGAIVMQPAGFATNFTERQGAVTRPVQRREYVIYPQRAGQFTIPGLTIQAISAGANGKPRQSQSAKSLPLSISIDEIPAVEKGASIVVASELRFSSSALSSVSGLVAGDAFERTLVIEANDTLAMLIAPLSYTAIEGLSLYPAEPKLQDFSDRGESRAVRSEKMSYRFERAGDFVIPEQRVRWWNPATQNLAILTIPALEISVAESSRERLRDSSAVIPSPWYRQYDSALLASLALVCLALLEWRLHWLRSCGQTIKRQQIRRRERRLASESYRFKQFLKACAKQQPQLALSAFYAWLDHGVPQHKGLQDFAAKSNIQGINLLQYAQELQAFLYAGQQAHTPDTRKFANAVATYRRQLIREAAKARTALLPALN